MATERTVLVRLRATADQFNREMLKARAAVSGLRDEIDTTNDRTAWMAQGILAVGPAAVTMGATAVPVLAGLATQATVGTAAIGTMLLAFNGVGDALKALNQYQLEPTAANLAKLDDAMAVLGTDGEQFVRVLDQVGEKLSVLGMDARAGMFPGMAEGLEALLGRLPALRRVVSEIAEGIGQLSGDAGRGIASSEFDEFFRFLETDAKPILIDTGRALGNFVQGFASLLVDFAPLTKSFTSGLLDMSRGFADWAAGLDETDGFQAFLQYIRDNGPDVMQLFGSLGSALVEIAKAAAPVGAVMVPALEALADVVAMLADTPLGSFLILGAALTSLYGRIVALKSIAGGPVFGPLTKGARESAIAAKTAVPSLRQFGTAALYAAHSNQALAIGLQSQSKIAQQASARALEARSAVTAFGRALVPAAGNAALFALAMSPIPEKTGLTNTAMGAMVGTMAGPWGIAIGTSIGLVADMAKGANDMADSLKAADAAIEAMDTAAMTQRLAELNDELDQLRDMDDVTGVGDWFDDLNSFQLWNDGDLSNWNGLNQEIGDRKDKIDELKDSLALADKRAKEFEQNQARMAEDTRLRQWAQQTSAAFVNLASDIKKPETSLNDLLKRMREQGRAAVEFGKNLREAIRNGADPQALQKLVDELGPQAGLALQQLAAGGKKSAREFNAAWGVAERGLGKVEDAVIDVDQAISRLPDGTVIRVTAETRAAQTMIERIKRMVEDIPKSRRVDVFVNYLRGATLAAQGGRDGDPSTPYANGGTIPGQRAPYRDKVLAFLAPGEEVISNRNGQADRWRPVLKAINANAMADGGTARVVPRITTTSAPTVEARASREAAAALKGLAREAKASEKSLTSLRNRRQTLLSARNDLRSSVSEGLQSDLWSGDVWSSSDPLSILRGDIANARAFRTGANTLRAKGLTGAALAEILRDGDLSRVQQMASMSKGQLTEYRELFNERARLVRADARLAGDAAYGPALAELGRKLDRLERAVDRSSKRNSGEHRQNRKSNKRGVGDGARNIRRG